jgi:hypothetical protein
VADLPLVLAGPLVRRVEPRRCSFWVALSQQATVTATIWSGPQFATAGAAAVASGDPSIGTGQATTRRLGSRLHVALVTVKLDPPAAPLTPGTIYSYNLSFSGAVTSDLRGQKLLTDEPASPRLTNVDAAAPRHLALGYLEDRLPGFVAPPAAVERLRLVHASCRKTNAPGYDALAWLDEEIEDSFSDPDERPQQLFLTGDQIYGDDVGACLLPMLNGLARDLLGGDENVPLKNTTFAGSIQNFPATRRARTVREHAGFTSTDAGSHLLTFGEFAAMYLAAWSPRVWRALATAAQIFVDRSGAAANVRDALTEWESQACFGSLANWLKKSERGFNDECAHVALYRDGVPHVARALANVATYMIFDDHEVTDDWNLNKRWRNRVVTKPLGKFVIRNALMAYGAFQAWGNDPEAFESSNNKDVLDETVKVLAGSGPFPAAATNRLDELFDLDGGGADKEAKWHYRVPGPRHLVAVMDTRSKRAFTGEGAAPPDLLGETLNSQIPEGPLAEGRELLVVVSPAPVLGPKVMDHVGQPLAQIWQDGKLALFRKERTDPCAQVPSVTGAEEYDAEGWTANEQALEKLLRRLGGHPKVILLSGDVHYGCTLELDFWRKGVAQSSRIVQLTSSPLRNEFKSTVAAILRSNALLQRYEVGESVERLAWETAAPITLPSGARIGPGRRARMRRKPSLLPSKGWPAGTTVPNDKPPDWSWRLKLVRDRRPNADLPTALQQQFLATDLDPTNPLPGYRAIAGRHQVAAATHFDHLRQMVFASNIGLVTLSSENGALVLRHTLLSQDAPESQTSAENTVHEASLAATSELAPRLETRSA